jgi:hypothetical protein
MYEHRWTRPIPWPLFLRRMASHFAMAVAMLLASLLLGIAGYMYFEHFTAIDAFLNASMLLGGMGPVDPPQTFGGKLFAGLYALYAGLLVLVVAGVLFAPVAHRLMHRLHWDENEGKKGAQ